MSHMKRILQHGDNGSSTNRKRSNGWVYPLSRLLYKYLIIPARGFKVSGLEHIPTTGGYIIVSNYLRTDDSFSILSCFPLRNPVHWMANDALFDVSKRTEDFFGRAELFPRLKKISTSWLVWAFWLPLKFICRGYSYCTHDGWFGEVSFSLEDEELHFPWLAWLCCWLLGVVSVFFMKRLLAIKVDRSQKDKALNYKAMQAARAIIEEGNGFVGVFPERTWRHELRPLFPVEETGTTGLARLLRAPILPVRIDAQDRRIIFGDVIRLDEIEELRSQTSINPERALMNRVLKLQP